MTSPLNSLLWPYLDYLGAANPFLSGVTSFCFYPGMLYRSEDKWWPDSGIRATLHEGVDICYYLDSTGVEQQITPSTKIPVVEQGELFCFCRDFLGHSVFVDHGISGPSRFLSVYAHIVPFRHLVAGQKVGPGDVVGKVVDTAGRKNRMPAHVHISLMRIPRSVSAQLLDWNFICISNQVELIDPMSMIDCRKVKNRTKNLWQERGVVKL